MSLGGQPSQPLEDKTGQLLEGDTGQPGQPIKGKIGQPIKGKIGQPSQPTRENDTSQPGQPLEDDLGKPGQPTNLKTSNLIPAYSDGKYDYFTRGDVADFLGVKVQSIHDGLSGKSKTQGDRLKQFGFEKVARPPVDAPKATIRRKITP